MDTPLQITFRGIPASEAIASYVEKRAARLDRHRPVLTACRATLEASRAHGAHHRITVEMMVKGTELVVSRDPADCHAREDMYAAIDDAFDDAVHMLDSHLAKAREARRRNGRSAERRQAG